MVTERARLMRHCGTREPRERDCGQRVLPRFQHGFCPGTLFPRFLIFLNEQCVLCLTAAERRGQSHFGRDRHQGAIVETECAAKKPQTIRIVQHPLAGGLWCAAWLFTIGYLHLSFWRGVLAILLWPYYIGVHVSALMK